MLCFMYFNSLLLSMVLATPELFVYIVWKSGSLHSEEAVNYFREKVPDVVLVFLLLTLNMFHTFF